MAVTAFNPGSADPTLSDIVQSRVSRALTAIQGANDYDDAGKRRVRQQAQLWELARVSTVSALGALADPQWFLQLLPSSAAPASAAPAGQSLSVHGAIGALEEAQRLFGVELIFILNASGYRPPPPAGDLVYEAAEVVYAAAAQPAPDSDTAQIAQAALNRLADRLVELRGKSTKWVRREVNPLRRKLASIAAGVGILMGAAVVEPIVIDIIKVTVVNQLLQLHTPESSHSQPGPGSISVPPSIGLTATRGSNASVLAQDSFRRSLVTVFVGDRQPALRVNSCVPVAVRRILGFTFITL